MFGPIGVITAIGVSAILGWFEFALLDSRLRDTTDASLTGQPVTQIVLDTVGKKSATVLMVSNVSCEGWYERWLLVGNRHRGDVLLRERMGPSPYRFVFTFAGCSCIMSTIPRFRFVLVRHSIVTLLSGDQKSFGSLVAFSLLRPRPSPLLGSTFPTVRDSNSLNTLPLCTNHLITYRK
jgi:hypothetical protein